MATSRNPQPESELVHQYHADAYVLSADLEEPLDRDIDPQAYVEIDEESNGQSLYKFDEAKPYRLKGIISYESGYTQVAGHKSPKAGHGFATLATSVVEGLNVLDVVTADRVVGQIATEHPLNGQVPSVTFLGTRFVNLRIGGHKVELDQDLHILGPKPAADKSYFEDDEVLRKVGKQYESINSVVGLPEWASQKYRWDRAAAKAQGRAECSLINRVTGAPTGISFGHVLDVPHFGKIFLGELTMTRTPAVSKGENETYHFSLAMIRLEMGCIAQGNATVVALDSNGTGKGKKGP